MYGKRVDFRVYIGSAWVASLLHKAAMTLSPLERFGRFRLIPFLLLVSHGGATGLGPLKWLGRLGFILLLLVRHWGATGHALL